MKSALQIHDSVQNINLIIWVSREHCAPTQVNARHWSPARSAKHNKPVSKSLCNKLSIKSSLYSFQPNENLKNFHFCSLTMLCRYNTIEFPDVSYRHSGWKESYLDHRQALQFSIRSNFQNIPWKKKMFFYIHLYINKIFIGNF